jgi:hypothetical protein
MKPKVLSIPMAALVALSAAPALAAGNAVITNPVGGMRIRLEVRAADNVDQTAPITQGRIELAPAEGRPVAGGRFFLLASARLRFADFSIDRWNFPQQNFRQVAVHLAQAVPFTATPAAPGVFTFSIPRERFLLEGSAVVNGEATSGTDRPSQAVTGTIDLNAGTFQATVVVPKRHGCGTFGCAVRGTLTVTMFGVLGPDTDGDGIRDGIDNCPLVPNPHQRPVSSPVITPPPDITLVTCGQKAIGRPAAVDLCEGLPIVAMSAELPSQWSLGLNRVTWTARTESGRVGGAMQQVTVVDRTAPAFASIPKPVVVDQCGPVDLGVPVAYDDCGFGPPKLSNDAPRGFGPGDTVVTWSASDDSGNSVQATQHVTVKDAAPPVFLYVPPDVKIARCTGADIGEPVAEDSCGVKITSDAPPTFPLYKETVVTWMAVDGAGNVATAKQSVTCVGGEDPR